MQLLGLALTLGWEPCTVGSAVSYTISVRAERCDPCACGGICNGPRKPEPGQPGRQRFLFICYATLLW
eukprot:7315754-Prymnesium_polylepis.4